MLTREDHDLAARDRHLPGLATLLNQGQILQIYRASLKGRSERSQLSLGQRASLRLEYIRYKPERRCIALFTIEHSDTRDDGHLATQVVMPEMLVVTLYCEQGWKKYQATGHAALAVSHGSVIVPEMRLAIDRFPHDRQLRSVAKLFDCEHRARMLRRIFNNNHVSDDLDLAMLAYKPGRRFVVGGNQSGRPTWTLKFYTDEGYATALQRTQLAIAAKLSPAQLMGSSDRYRTIATSWVSGSSLPDLYSRLPCSRRLSFAVGYQLAVWHSRACGSGIADKLRPNAYTADSRRELAGDVGLLQPLIRQRAVQVAEQLTNRLQMNAANGEVIHGDFYAKQVVIADGFDGTGKSETGHWENIHFIDFDALCLGDRYQDVGNFVAKMIWNMVREELSSESCRGVIHAFLEGYQAGSHHIDEARLRAHIADAILRCLPHAFRRGLSHWPQRMEQLLRLVELWLDHGTNMDACIESIVEFTPSAARHLPEAPTVAANNPFVASPAEKELTRFLDEALVEREMRIAFNSIAPQLTACRIAESHLLRHKPGRRALIEYCFVDAVGQTFTVLGKTRLNKGLDRHTHRLHQQLCTQAGFVDQHRTLIPQSLGAIPSLNMWLQVKYSGQGLTCDDRTEPDLHGRAAIALSDLHHAAISIERSHDVKDELAHLEGLFAQLTTTRPDLRQQLELVLDRCNSLGESLSQVRSTLIHRDFYFDQVLVVGNQMLLVDLDLASMGPPELDVGNYLAHLDEHCIRFPESAGYCQRAAERFLLAYVQQCPDTDLNSVQTWRELALARHVALSQKLAGRAGTTAKILSRILSPAQSINPALVG